jgi:hypothetical protein
LESAAQLSIEWAADPILELRAFNPEWCQSHSFHRRVELLICKL